MGYVLPETEMMQYSCSNPDCNNVVEITREQKKQFFVEYFRRYGIISLPYCSSDCQQKHQEMLAEKPGVVPTEYKDHGNRLRIN